MTFFENVTIWGPFLYISTRIITQDSRCTWYLESMGIHESLWVCISSLWVYIPESMGMDIESMGVCLFTCEYCQIKVQIMHI